MQYQNNMEALQTSTYIVNHSSLNLFLLPRKFQTELDSSEDSGFTKMDSSEEFTAGPTFCVVNIYARHKYTFFRCKSQEEFLSTLWD